MAKLIGMAADHAGYELKEALKPLLNEMGYEVKDFGTHSTDSCDYPEFGEKVGRAVVAGEADCGILICGTGVGISIAANKVKGVRAGVCSDVATAHLIKEHNNANILCFGERIVGEYLAKDICKIWLDTPFAQDRHLKY